MNFKKIIILIFLINLKVFSQTVFDKKIFLDSLWNETTQENSIYYRIIEDYYKEKEVYTVKDFYNSDKLQMMGESTTKDYINHEGEFIYYYENGNKKASKNFKKGKLDGKSTLWYENGNIKLESEYINEQNSLEPPKLLINQFWDIENNQKVANGKGYYFEENLNEILKGEIINGLKNGIWTGTIKPFKLSFEEKYDTGKLISGKSIDSLKKEHNYETVYLSPRPKKGIEHFYKYIAKKYNVSKRVFKKELIIVGFTVDEEGKLSDFKTLQGVSEESDNEAIRVVSEYKDWIPGEYRGIKTKFPFKIPIKIQPSP